MCELCSTSFSLRFVEIDRIIRQNLTENRREAVSIHSIRLFGVNPFKPEFTIFYIHYKPRIAVAIVDL